MTRRARAIIAELLGTFFLLFIGGLAIWSALAAGGSLVIIALGFGFALLAGLYAFGEISGGHFNPAVSLGAWLDTRLDAATFVQYVVAQTSGAVLAGLALLWAASGSDTFASAQDGVAVTATVPTVGVVSAFLIEALLTAIFVGMILKVGSSDLMGPSAFLAIPLSLVAITLAASPLTGASVNPARTLGSAIIGGEFTDVWIYLTAPFVGGAAGWYLYHLVTRGNDA